MLYRVRWFTIAFSMVLALTPFAGLVAAAFTATLLGCEINDAAQTPCVLLGVDFHPLFAVLLSTVSLGEITMPILTVVLMLWVAIEGILFVFGWWRRRRARSFR